MRKLVGWLLIVHGIICLLGAFFPFYPPVFLFYGFFPGPFALKLVLVLLSGAAQVVAGAYLIFVERLSRVRWYWFALPIFVIVAALLVFPLLNHFLGF